MYLGVERCIIVDPVITYTLSIGAVRNADRMNQRYECLIAFPGACTPQNRTISVNFRNNNRLSPRPGRFGFLTEPDLYEQSSRFLV